MIFRYQEDDEGGDSPEEEPEEEEPEEAEPEEEF